MVILLLTEKVSFSCFLNNVRDPAHLMAFGRSFQRFELPLCNSLLCTMILLHFMGTNVGQFIDRRSRVGAYQCRVSLTYAGPYRLTPLPPPPPPPPTHLIISHYATSSIFLPLQYDPVYH